MFRCIKVDEEIQQGLFETKYYCHDPDGLPFTEGNRFIEWVNTHTTTEKTALNYIKDTFMLISYFASIPNPVSHLSPPDEIRKAVKKYIENELGWHVKPHRDGNYVIERREVNRQTGEVLAKILPKTLQNRIHSWKEYYRFLIEEEKSYQGENPFSWKIKKDGFSNVFIPTMPPRSGMSLPKKRHWETNTFFCVVEDDWEPHIIGDPHLANIVIDSANKSDPVYKIILRILFEGGPRVHEVLSLNVGDCRKVYGKTIGARAINKGSGMERVKTIHWTPQTERMIRNYINTDRKKFDHLHRGIVDLPDHSPLFINRAGNRITYGGFYRQYRKICDRAQIKLTTHQIRHSFVTNFLRKLNETVPLAYRESYRRKFIKYMNWRNAETIEVYDHYLGEISDEELHEVIDQKFVMQEQTQAINSNSPKELSPEIKKQLEEFQKFLSQEINDDE
jgi:hypothetical protein